MIPFIKHHFGSISRKIVILGMLSGLFGSLAVTVSDSLVIYEQTKTQTSIHFEAAGKYSASILEDSLWTFDRKSTDSLLKTVASMPGVSKARLILTNGEVFEVGTKKNITDSFVRTFPITHDDLGKTVNLGTIVLEKDLSEEKGWLSFLLLTRFAGNLLMLAISISIIFLVYRGSVGIKLEILSRELKSTDPESLRRYAKSNYGRLQDSDIANDEVEDIALSTQILKLTAGAALLDLDGRNSQLEIAQRLTLSIIDAAPVRVFWKDKKSRYLGCNRLFVKDAGQPSSESMFGKSDYDMPWASMADAYVNDDKIVMSTKKPKLGYEEKQITPEGEVIWLRTSKVPLFDMNNNVIGILGVYDDITKQRESELELTMHRDHLHEMVMERTKELEAAIGLATSASAAKGDFLANMSHEIRTPLNAITGMARLIKKETLSEAQTKHLDILTCAGEHLLEMINSILDLSKIESGKMTLNCSTFKIDSLLNNIHDMVLDKVHNKGLILRINKRDLSDFYYGDETKLRQCILNYVSNAIKFTERGLIEINASYQNGNLSISVADTGVGIPEESIPKLFSSFEQVDGGIARKYGGTGLGLAITKKMIEMMGGEVSLTSVLGKGSTFSFSIPLPTCSTSAHDSGVDVNHEQVLINEYSGKKILLVDDEPINRMIALELLTDVGMTVLEAENGQDALDLYKTARDFDIIFMDMQMPLLDGVETTKKIRDFERENKLSPVPIIAMTANAFDDDRRKCMDAGMDDFITKPIAPEVLFERIYKVLSSRNP